VRDSVLPDVRLEVAQLRGQLWADVGLDRVPGPDLDEAVYETVGERLRVREARPRAAAAAREEQGKRK
jgi:hypothetical protein